MSATVPTGPNVGDRSVAAAAMRPPVARTLLDIFDATVNRCGGRVAIDGGDATLTYEQLSAAADELAGRLRAIGIGAGDRVGVRAPSGTTDPYVAILGVLRSGAAYVPVDADDPPARATDIWRRSAACAVIEAGLVVTELAPGVGSGLAMSVDDDAWVIFTSGSTGAPKGVAITHRSAAAFVDAEAELWALNGDDRVLAGLSVGFDASCEEMWLAWRHGAALVPAPRCVVRSGAELGPWMAAHGITVVSTVPTLAALWDESALAGVRLVILGGEACPEGLAWRLAADGRSVWNTYGPTEATVVTTATRVDPGQKVTIGWPLSGWEVAVVDSEGEPVPLGEPGELAIAGVGLGCYIDSELDSERFAPLPALAWERAYRTGDMVRETVDGLEFIGRRDDQVKIGGRRIELGEIDAELRSVPGVRAACTEVQESSAGNKLLVGYVVGDVEEAHVRATIAERLPEGIVPLIVSLDALPMGSSGKVDRKALPWPPPARPGAPETEAPLTPTAAWLAERWADQLGPQPMTAGSDFFGLGGTSLAAAKAVSAIRSRFPSVAVADVYNHRSLGALAARLDEIGAVDAAPARERRRRPRGWGLMQLGGVFALRVLATPGWLIGVLALDRLEHGRLGPQVGWGWLIAGWLVFMSVPGRALLLALGRKLALRDLRPGRYPRHGSLMFRIWLLERLATVWRLDTIEGTPWASRYARLCGHPVARGARLFTLPPMASLVRIGEDATIEPDVDMHGWWIEGDDLVVGSLEVGARSRVGTRTVLMPGAEIGADAEIEPGSVVNGPVPAGQRWAGSPARKIGRAGESWPPAPAPAPRNSRFWTAMYGVAMTGKNLLAIAAVLPGVLALIAFAPKQWNANQLANDAIVTAPLFVLTFLAGYGLMVALIVRAVSPLARPGWHPEYGGARWALWLTDSLMESANRVLFPLYMSVYTRFWLRLVGIPVGKRAEVSVAAGLNRLTTLGEMSFVADAAMFATTRSRGGWLHVAPIELGRRSFMGNGAVVRGSTKIGDGCLIGVLTAAPTEVPDGTSWFGCPALELPRRPDPADPRRTTHPPRRLVIARGAIELVRIFLPASLSVVLGSFMFSALERIGMSDGLSVMALAAPCVFVTAGLCAVAVTVALKWLLMGRYRRGEHPFWSLFVWRDEIMNTAQETLAGTWLLSSAMGTPLMSAYLRAMGSKVGRDVWCDTMTITEFDMVELGEGCVVNRAVIVETHLYHDRLLRIGPLKLGAGSTIGPMSAALPDSTIGEETSVGARSVVMRGEQLPARTRWHGAPVVAV